MLLLERTTCRPRRSIFSYVYQRADQVSGGESVCTPRTTTVRVAVHMVAPFLDFPIAPQTVPQAAQQLADRRRRMTDRMMPVGHRMRQRSCALAGPSQRRLGIAAAVGGYDGFQHAHQCWISDGDLLAPATGPPNASRREGPRLGQFLDPTAYDPPRQTARPTDAYVRPTQATPFAVVRSGRREPSSRRNSMLFHATRDRLQNHVTAIL